ncbi:unnamed protein product [Nesidiocoris tenuis]|uniref:Uncharacterized protein n=1 Tax=Nesidiocoris tenuis TaxID=355587 RepID=A0A6H5HHT8_9HEMI|nr:unnamed protein product [Nesidiocoris tenuis]
MRMIRARCCLSRNERKRLRSQKLNNTTKIETVHTTQSEQFETRCSPLLNVSACSEMSSGKLSGPINRHPGATGRNHRADDVEARLTDRQVKRGTGRAVIRWADKKGKGTLVGKTRGGILPQVPGIDRWPLVAAVLNSKTLRCFQLTARTAGIIAN